MNEFEKLCQQFKEGSLSADSHQVSAQRISEFPESQLVFLENLNEQDHLQGLEVLQKGQWARLILNGGMATRFGGKVKGICEVFEGKTFLELKLEHMKNIEEQFGLPEIPVALMNSRATDALTRKYLEENNFFERSKLTTFVQKDFPRLTLQGDLYEGSDDKKYAPRGHGDFLEGLDESGVLGSWLSAGVTHLDFSNIDNLGATIEPRLVGRFVSSRKPMGIELAKKNPGDQGGAACLRDGIKGVLEGLYFDSVFDQDRLPWFNTNNLFFSVAGLKHLLSQDSNFQFPWNVVQKKVEDQPVIQFERIAIDSVFGFNQSPTDDQVLFFAVPREGSHGRFYPVKSPEDLKKLQETLKDRLQTSCL